MRGRVYGRKKSMILLFTAILMLFSFVSLCFLDIFVLKKPELWFFCFCLCVGVYELVRASLFGVDNSLYLGSLLLFVGIDGFLIEYTPIERFSPLLIALSFALASFLTFLFFGQVFHLITAFSILFVTLYGFLLIKNLISFQIFIAFVVLFLVLLIVIILLNINWRK